MRESFYITTYKKFFAIVLFVAFPFFVLGGCGESSSSSEQSELERFVESSPNEAPLLVTDPLKFIVHC